MRRCRTLLLFLPLCLMLLTRPSLAATKAAQQQPTTTSRAVVPSRYLGRLRSLSALTVPHLAASTPPGNFPFQTLTSSDGLIILHYYQQPAAFASQVLASVQQYLQHPVQDTLGFTLKHAVTIYIYNSRADFLQGAGVANPEEVGAYTIPEKSEIFAPVATADDAVQFLPHELTHVVFHQNEDSGHLESNFFTFFPHWLDEGLAAYDEDAINANEYTVTVNQAASNHVIVDILQDFVNDYPANANTNYLCYAESRAFIAFLVTTYRQDKLHRFLANAGDDGLQLDAETTFGLDLPQLLSHWEITLGLPPAADAPGYLPVVASPVPFQPGKLNAIAGQTTPFALPVSAIPEGWLYVLLLVLGLAISVPIREWRSQQPKPAQVMSPLPYPYPTPALPLPPAAGDIASVSLYDGEQMVSTPPTTDVAAASRPAIASPPSWRWYDVLLVLAPAPLAWLVGTLRAELDPFHSYYDAYIAAALVSLLFLLVSLWLVVRDRRARQVRFTRYAGVVVSLFLFVATWLLALPVGEGQEQAYERGGAYALALHYLAAMHAPASADARVQTAWGNAAASALDYRDAVTHLQAAIALAPTSAQSAQDRVQLAVVLKAWDQSLIAAGQFAPALQMLTMQQGMPMCDAACHAAVAQALYTTAFAWGNDLLVSGDLAGAITQFQAALQHAPGDAKAGDALLQTQAVQALQQALAAGANGDAATMNTRLQALTTMYPATGAAREAATTPEPVTGVIGDGSGAAVTGDRLILLAFPTATAARGFTFDFNKDTTVFKIATTIGVGGKFSVRLPPGYWYVAVWDDPSQAGNNDFNAPQALDNAAFTVQSLTSHDVGTIEGF